MPLVMQRDSDRW